MSIEDAYRTLRRNASWGLIVYVVLMVFILFIALIYSTRMSGTSSSMFAPLLLVLPLLSFAFHARAMLRILQRRLTRSGIECRRGADSRTLRWSDVVSIKVADTAVVLEFTDGSRTKVSLLYVWNGADVREAILNEIPSHVVATRPA